MFEELVNTCQKQSSKTTNTNEHEVATPDFYKSLARNAPL